MNVKYSKDRVYCANYMKRHRRKVHFRKNFVRVSSLDEGLLNSVLTPEQFREVHDADYLCHNCCRHIKEGGSLPGDTSIDASSCPLDTSFVDEGETVESLNTTLTSSFENISPLKPPSQVKEKSVESYAKRKHSEIVEAFSENLQKKISSVYGGPSSKQDAACNLCPEWIQHLRLALRSAASYQERCRLLTLVPTSLSKQDILSLIPEATKHLIDRARKLRAEAGVYARPDPYAGHGLKEEDVALAVRYYTDDDLDCSVQSPEKRDVVSVYIEGNKVHRTKRYMTRTIRETYKIFRDAHPDATVGPSKFYSLRPKWVKCTPYREECLCIYCANFTLCLTAIRNASGVCFAPSSAKSFFLCSEPSARCMLRECKDCSEKRGLTLSDLSVDEDDEITFATWEKGDLIRRDIGAPAFLNEVTNIILKYIPHEYIRGIQRVAIAAAKSSLVTRSVVFLFDFAENWSVVIPRAVQGYHWRNQQVSIFTCVVTTCKRTYSFAVISDDTCHDSSHALAALNLIQDWLDENAPIFTTAIFVSDGAASHFKNRYQLHEFLEKTHVTRWIFSATGHGKGAADGIGGLVKHLASTHNLRSSSTDIINSAATMVTALTPKIEKTVLLLLDATKLEAFRAAKKEEWTALRPATGIQSAHMWSKTTDARGQVAPIMSRTAGECASRTVS